MKIKFFVLSFLLLLNTCSNNSKTSSSNNNCEDELKQTKDTLTELKTVLQNNYKAMFPIPDDIGNQELISIQKYNSESNTIPVKDDRYKVSGIIDSKKGTLDIIVPVTENKLRIVNYINVSTEKTNAILLVLDGNNGKGTNVSPITSVIKKKIKLKKIGLSSNLEQLFVFVLHDNDVNNRHIIEYINCLTNNPEYTRDNECLKLDKLIPLERGGDIVP
jgi:hypothetical protein